MLKARQKELAQSLATFLVVAQHDDAGLVNWFRDNEVDVVNLMDCAAAWVESARGYLELMETAQARIAVAAARIAVEADAA